MVVSWLRLLKAGIPLRRSGCDSRSDHVGFVVDKVALRQIFSEYLGFPCQFSFHNYTILIIIIIILNITRGWYSRPSSGRSTKRIRSHPIPLIKK
jgi:hypothetical protein